MIVNLPFLPPKSILKLSDNEIDKRKIDLEKYCKILFQRRDIMNTKVFKEFFNVI